jgi:hypothetical protein
MCDMQCATLHVRGSKALLGLGKMWDFVDVLWRETGCS